MKNKIMNLYKYLGKNIYGYCNSYFGRDSYETKRIVFAGVNYIVVEHEDALKTPGIAYFHDKTKEEVEQLLKDWMDPTNEDYY